jgi:hypothetical protein
MTYDGEFNMSREELKTRLKDVIATVTFEKKDGTLRQMRCTLKESYLPTFVEQEKNGRKENLDVLPVWDIDEGGWRSFRLDTIKSVSFT